MAIGEAEAPRAPARPSQSGSFNETDAIKEAQKGRHEAFEFLYRLHSKRVYSLCLRMTRNASTAEDLTQSAFVQVFRKIQSFRGDSAFSTWLHRVTVNVVLMYLRKKTLPEVSLEGTEDANGERADRVEIASRDRSLEGRIDRVNLERAMAQLPPGYREIFTLHDVMGYEHHEIATILRCSVGNSKSQLHKARLRLRSILLPERTDGRQELATVDETAAPSMAGQPARNAASRDAGEDTTLRSDVRNCSLCQAR
jgi:RNA polymerase sigma-70 factor (ECF subfamily)